MPRQVPGTPASPLEGAHARRLGRTLFADHSLCSLAESRLLGLVASLARVKILGCWILTLDSVEGQGLIRFGVQTFVVGWNWDHANQKDWWAASGVSSGRVTMNPPPSRDTMTPSAVIEVVAVSSVSS